MIVQELDELMGIDSLMTYSYNRVWFHKLNAHKVNKVLAFWFGAPKQKGCFIGGVEDNILKFPYSAPFAMVETFKECSNKDFEDFAKEVDVYSSTLGMNKVEIKLPPMFYDEANITKWLGALLRNGFKIHELELDYYIIIEDDCSYRNKLHKNGRKNLNHALQKNYQLFHCETELEKEAAYRIIESNRRDKNYYLSMSWEEVQSTYQNLEHDFFILRLDGEKIASAIVFNVIEDIWQVIYWGNLSGTDNDRPMNYLAYALQNYYRNRGIKILDIGPSMLNGKPNYGLCDFKESIGCAVSSKFCLEKHYKLETCMKGELT